MKDVNEFVKIYLVNRWKSQCYTESIGLNLSELKNCDSMLSPLPLDLVINYKTLFNVGDLSNNKYCQFY